jgi:hypothetical protein
MDFDKSILNIDPIVYCVYLGQTMISSMFKKNMSVFFIVLKELPISLTEVGSAVWS